MMESVEVPLPANAVVPKLLGNERVNGSIAESKIRAFSVPVLSPVNKFSTTLCNSSQADSSNMGVPVPVLKSGLQCTVKTGTNGSPYNSSLVNSSGKACGGPNFQATEKGLLSKLPERTDEETKSKVGKGTRNGGPSRKRSRPSQGEDSLNLVDGTNIRQVLADKILLNDAPCAAISNEKSGKIRKKQGQACKRVEKRNRKPEPPTGGDYISIKAGSVNSNLAAGGNNILGIYGLRAEPINVLKYMADLSLTDLLNGHCKVARLSRMDMRESNNNNENVLQCVQNVCNILPSLSVTSMKNANTLDSSYNMKCQLSKSSLGPNSVNRINFDAKLGDTIDDEKVADVSSPRKEVGNKESCAADLKDSMKATPRPVFPIHNLPFYQPEEFLRRLKLPPVETLDSLILQTPVKGAFGLQSLSVPQSNTHGIQNGCIPPFPWSLPLGGTCKSIQDPGKLSANRNTNQRQWIRIRTTECMDKFCLNESMFVNNQKDGGMKSKSGHITAMHESEKKLEGCVDVPTGITFVGRDVPCPTTCALASQDLDKRDSKLLKNTDLINVSHQSEFKSPEGNNFPFHPYQEKNGSSPNEQCRSQANKVETNVECEENESCMNQLARDRTGGLTDRHLQAPGKSRMFNEAAANASDNITRASTTFLVEDNTPVPVSPRILAAAQTLHDMAHGFPYREKKSQSNEKNRRQAPEVSFQKAAKVQKTRHSMGKDAEFDSPLEVEMKNLKCRAGGSSTPQNKASSFERKKSLSQVNDTSRTVKHSALITGRVPGWIAARFRGAGEFGASHSAIGLRESRGFHDQARENSGDVGTCLASSAVTPLQEASLKNVPRETHSQAVGSTIPPLPGQKGGIVRGLKSSQAHFLPRGNGGASAKPNQSHIATCRNSTDLLGSSSRMQSTVASVDMKSRQTMSFQEGTKSRDSYRGRSNRP
eukprot:Gb_23368 [translate_table: standard]